MNIYTILNDKFIEIQEKLSEYIKEFVINGFFITLYVVTAVVMFCGMFKINVAQFFN